MKKLMLFLFCFVCLAPVFSQTYHPLIQSSAFWDEFLSGFDPLICYYGSGQRWWFGEDSVADGKTYRKLLSTPIVATKYPTIFCPPYAADTLKRSYRGLMREDTAAQQIYMRDESGEYLLFDFKVKAGDSLLLGKPLTTVVVSSVETHVAEDGSLRRKIRVLPHNHASAVWIEGIGNTNDLWNPLHGMCICFYGICHTVGKQPVFSNVSCAELVNTKETALRDDGLISVFPNPAREVLHITLSPAIAEAKRMVVTDTRGAVVTRQDNPVFPLLLSVADWPTGVYVLQLWLNDNQSITRKINIVQRTE